MDEALRRAASHSLGDPLLVGRPVAEPRTRAPLDRGRAMRLAGAVGVTSLSVLTAYAVSVNGHSRTADAAGTSSGGDVAESVATTAADGAVVPPSAAAAPASVIVTTSSPESIPPSTTAPAVCTNVYTVIAGDSWTRIASRASIGVADLYAVNAAGPSTPLYPDQAVCLPGGAAVVVPVIVVTTPSTVAATPKTSTTKTSTTTSTKKTSTTVQPAQPAPVSHSSSHPSS